MVISTACGSISTPKRLFLRIFAYIFGGLAKGKIGPLSDIDIAVYLGSTEKRKFFVLLTDTLRNVTKYNIYCFIINNGNGSD